MNFEIKVLQPENADLILGFENELLQGEISDPMEQEFARWHAKWRPEALEHYLSLGWSFGLWTDENPKSFVGYFLAQPFLFFRGMTQTLWIEHIAYRDATSAQQLVELAYRMARDKRLQKVVFHTDQDLTPALGIFSGQKIQEGLFEIKAAKF